MIQRTARTDFQVYDLYKGYKKANKERVAVAIVCWVSTTFFRLYPKKTVRF